MLFRINKKKKRFFNIACNRTQRQSFAFPFRSETAMFSLAWKVNRSSSIKNKARILFSLTWWRDALANARLKEMSQVVFSSWRVNTLSRINVHISLHKILKITREFHTYTYVNMKHTRARGREREGERESEKERNTYFSCKRNIVFCHYFAHLHTSHLIRIYYI